MVSFKHDRRRTVKYSAIAQLVEHTTYNREVAGSSPTCTMLVELHLVYASKITHASKFKEVSKLVNSYALMSAEREPSDFGH